MPYGDGTGPAGKGPMTGKGNWFLCCEDPGPRRNSHLEGFLGRVGRWYCEQQQLGKEEFTMPGLDRTGPLGMGPMTGRGLGICGGWAGPAPYWGGRGRRGGGFRNRRWFYGRGMGWAAGPGYGYPGWWGPWIQGGAFGTPPAAGLADDETLDILKTQAQHLENTLKEVRDRIERLTTKKTGE